MNEMKFFGSSGDSIFADKRDDTYWINGQDAHGNVAAHFVTPAQARQIIDVLEEYAVPAKLATKPCACGDEIPADATRCAKCDEVGAKAEGGAE